MKGIMFTEFLEMVEARFGLGVMDRVIARSALSTDGAYTAVGNYDHAELLRLAEQLSIETGTPLPDLMFAFSDTVFSLFKRRYGSFIGQAKTCFEFLSRIESYIHVEVRKLYPDAELPHFSYPAHDINTLIMDYRSPRPMAVFAEGLVTAAIRHYGEPIVLSVQDLSDGAGNAARFTLQRRLAA